VSGVQNVLDQVVDLARVRGLLDLDRRLEQIPPSGTVRGFIFKMTADEVARHGRAAVALYRRLSPVKSTWFFRMYPLRDFLEDAAAGAAAIDPADPKEALRRIWRNATHYAPMFNAQRFLSLLSASPFDAMRWLEMQRDMFLGYGGWRVERRDEHYFVVHYFDEYIWIDSAHKGGVEGLLEACNATGALEVDLDTPFNGRIHVRWRPIDPQ
jgi:uncharacterized protein (TIGR02265 family)